MTEYEHPINLTAMWQIDNIEHRRHVNLADMDWSAESLPLTLTRRFNKPSNLDEQSIVRLELKGLPPNCELRLNQQQLGLSDVDEFDIAQQLQPGQNVIEMIVRELPQQTAAVASARLKITQSN